MKSIYTSVEDNKSETLSWTKTTSNTNTFQLRLVFLKKKPTEIREN